MIENIQLIPFNQVIFYEQYDKERVTMIENSIADEKILIDLPAALKTSSNQYLILDGTHRTLALRNEYSNSNSG